MPQTPLHGRDVPVNGKQYIGTVRVGAAEVIGDLLHRLDLHGDVEQSDVSCRLRHRPGQALEDFGAVRDHGDVAETAIPFLPKGMQSSIPDCGLVGAARREIAAADITPTAVAASGHNELEVSP